MDTGIPASRSRWANLMSAVAIEPVGCSAICVPISSPVTEQTFAIRTRLSRMEFRPTLPPPGRLVRLGLIMHTRSGSSPLPEIARMCDGAGFDALWLEDRLVGTHDASPVNALTTLAAVAPDVRRARLGAMLDPALRSPVELATVARSLDDVLDGRLELTFKDASQEYAAIVRGLAGELTLAIEGESEGSFVVAARRRRRRGPSAVGSFRRPPPASTSSAPSAIGTSGTSPRSVSR